MGRYAVRRLLHLVPVLLGTVIVLYLALYLLPADPAQSLVGLREVSPELREAMNQRYGFDRSLPEQIGRYLSNVVRLDFGESAVTRESVRGLLADRIPTTAALAGVALMFMAILGVGSGLIAGARPAGWFDGASSAMAAVLVSVPVFVLGIMLQVFVALRFKDVLGLPATGLDEGFRSYILPGFTLAAASIAYVSRVQRSSLLEALSSDHVMTARAKGLSERRIVLRHGWRNSLIPVITFIGLDAGAFLGGAVLTETVFNINGLGRAIADAIETGDNQVVLGGTLFIVLAAVLINFVVDLTYGVIDPRVRAK